MLTIVNIKKLRLLLTLPLIALLISGCSKKLEITPETFVSPEELYKDGQGATAGVTGIYRRMMEFYNGDYYFFGIVGTDEGKTTSFVPTWGGYWQHYDGVNSYNSLLGAQNQLVQGVWNALYKGVINTNIAIKYIPRSTASQDLKDRLLGESKFFRAVFYFKLVQFFGAIPLPTEVEDPAADANGGKPRSSVEEVYALITDDLKFAAEHLQPKGVAEVGRINREAAIALLGKVYLTTKDYANAKLTLQPLMSASNVALMPDYADLFKEANENNIESLFEVQYSNENGNTNGQANTLGGWHISNTDSGGGGHVVIPTDYYANSFETGDERKNASIRYAFFDANGNPVDNSWWADVGKPHVKKYDITKGKSLNGGLSSRNLYYLRYADAVLMYAETLNELNETGDALTYLNRIRTRAKLANWETVLGHTPSQQELRDELLKERMRELGFEGWRWDDLKRTGKLIDQTKTYNPDATNYISEKNLLFPISSVEFERNRSLKPTDQNPGF
ncbi:MAG: RagB/SusD family nutrient uptake outer membrane protein [Chitinophagaceae bacterium]